MESWPIFFIGQMIKLRAIRNIGYIYAVVEDIAVFCGEAQEAEVFSKPGLPRFSGMPVNKVEIGVSLVRIVYQQMGGRKGIVDEVDETRVRELILYPVVVLSVGTLVCVFRSYPFVAEVQPVFRLDCRAIEPVDLVPIDGQVISFATYGLERVAGGQNGA